MLALSPLSDLPLAAALDASGGFFWWYLDGLDAAGDGFVLIASFGLPFLPGSRARPVARDRPTLNLVVYRGGEPDFYLLQTHDAADAHFDEAKGVLTIGDTTLRLERDGERYRLKATIDAAVPDGGGRLTGTIESDGLRCQWADGAEPLGATSHCWEPIALAQRGRVSLQLNGKRLLEQDARIYMDSNASKVGLHELGIEQWRWGRLAFPSCEQVYYFVQPQEDGGARAPVSLSVTAAADGSLNAQRDTTFSWAQSKRNKYGVSYDGEMRFASTTVKVTQVVDEGPFYLRFLIEGHDHQTGETGRGFAEVVQPGMIDRRLHRPFVAMRHQEVGKENSVWLPLFSGRRVGRVARLANKLWSKTERLSLPKRPRLLARRSLLGSRGQSS